MLTTDVKTVSKLEKINEDKLTKLVANGRVVIPHNPHHDLKKVCGIGENLRVKVNANLGTSLDYVNFDEELEKARIAVKYGADAVMDLSIGGDIEKIRKLILKELDVPFGTVPIYQAGIRGIVHRGAIVHMTEDDMFNAIESHAKDGVDFIVVHAGVTLESVNRLKNQKRLINIVSRGGAFHTSWILYNEKENPFYSNFEYLLEIAKKYDLTLSLGDGFRSGCIHDANDRVKLQELLIIGELVEIARQHKVQVIVEGPGHVPLNLIESNIRIMKSVTKGAPYYVLGPLVTDIAPGYDHIAAAIGGALAGFVGADFLCYVTPSEHLCLPTVEDVKEGVIAARIAAHAADVAKGISTDWDLNMAKYRNALNWKGMLKLSIDPDKATEYRAKRKPVEKEVCSMCGKLCAIKILRDYLKP
jgi:phosphomethylpyrimidine synthase